MDSQNDRVKLNVGGRIFETTSITLANAGRNSMLGAMFDATWNPFSPVNNDGYHYFLDRNPDYFTVILDFLRTGELHIPVNLSERLLYKEALYYGLLDRVRTAKRGPFDGNRLKLSRSLACRPHSNENLIRGGPEGGCCVALGGMVYVYDWMMDEHPPINLDYQQVNDIGWVDSRTIIVGVKIRPDGGSSGMGLFNCSTGELCNKFVVCHEGQVRSYSAGALCFDRNNKVMSSCRGSSNEGGVGVWDLEAGKQVDFFYEPNEWSLGNARRLQWLDGCNNLFMASFNPDEYKNDYCYISLLDFRDKKMVWSWSDNCRSRQCVHDAVATEDNRYVCVVDWYGGVGILDLRCTATVDSESGIKWISSEEYMYEIKEWTYPKLALHGGQLFCSFNDCISVINVSDWFVTSKLRRSTKDLIYDFSIGGDRLFALHKEEDVFDIWETPTPPII